MLARLGLLKKEFGEGIFKYVRKLHNGMGHPSAAVLAKTLENASARQPVIECAKRFECAACRSRRPPPAAAKSGPPAAKHFNDRVQMDVFYIKTETGKVAVLHMVDVATRFGTARVLEQETGTTVVRAVERAWIRPYGPMLMLQCDEARPFCGDELKLFMERYGIEPQVAPGEAHTRLGIIERRHQVLRTAVENYMSSEDLALTIDSIREAVEYVTPAMNNLSFTKGYTPSQWVLNSNPKDPTALTDDDFVLPAHYDAATDPTFADEVERRMAARTAFLRADSDARLRRALLRRHRAIKMPMAIGQKCYYWREAGAPRLLKCRWRGPATALMREEDQAGRPHTYWVVHGTSLLRVAPEHLRPVVEDEGATLQDNVTAAKTAAEGIRARSTTQYIDLRNTRLPTMDLDTDDEDMDAAGDPARTSRGSSTRIARADGGSEWRAREGSYTPRDTDDDDAC